MPELALVEYRVTDAAIAELKAKYTGLKITDGVSYENVRLALADVRSKRTGIEEARLEFGRKVLAVKKQADDKAKEITAALLEIESPLKAEKDRVDDEKTCIKAAKGAQERERVAAIRARIFDMQKIVSTLNGKTAPELQVICEQFFDADITKEGFEEFTEEAERVKLECLDAALKAREARVRWDHEEALRMAEAARLAMEREKQEAEAKRLADEKAKLEEEKKAEQDRKDREEIERQAKGKAEREARERVEREAKEKKEREEAEAKEKERKAAMAPDKEKLLAFADELAAVRIFDVNSDAAHMIVRDAMRALSGVIAMIRKEAEKL